MLNLIESLIFADYLFTTKGVGKSTGLGLAIAGQIVVEKHGGQLVVESEVGDAICDRHSYLEFTKPFG